MKNEFLGEKIIITQCGNNNGKINYGRFVPWRMSQIPPLPKI